MPVKGLRLPGRSYLGGKRGVHRAAAGLYALENHLPQIAAENANARHLAQGLAAIPRVHLDLSTVSTNLVFFSVDGMTADDARRRLLNLGVLTSGSGGRLRAVTHLDVSIEDVAQAIAVAQQAFV